jgi:hypothetical protein
MGCERGSRVVVVACRRPRPASRCGTCGWGTAGVSPVLFCGPEGPRHASLYATAGPAVQGNSGPEGPSSLTPRPRGPRLHGWHSLPKCPGTFLRAGGLRGAGQQAARARSPCVCSEACLGGAPPERMCESARPEKTRRGGGRSSRGGRWVDPRRSLVSQHCHRGRPRVAPTGTPPPPPLGPDPRFRTRSLGQSAGKEDRFLTLFCIALLAVGDTPSARHHVHRTPPLAVAHRPKLPCSDPSPPLAARSPCQICRRRIASSRDPMTNTPPAFRRMRL